MHTTRNYQVVLWILWPQEALHLSLPNDWRMLNIPCLPLMWICCKKKCVLWGSPAGHFLYWSAPWHWGSYSVAVMSSVTMSKSLKQTSFVNYLQRENGSLSVICLSVIEDTTLHHNCAFRFLLITIHSSLITMCWVILWMSMVVKCWHILIEFR